MSIPQKADYTWRCDCEAEGESNTLSEAKKEARQHKQVCDKVTEGVFIDEYDLELGELSGRYWKA